MVHTGAACNAIVLVKVCGVVIEGIELVLFVLAEPVLPAFNLVGAPLHRVGGVLQGIAFEAVDNAVARHAAVSINHLTGPEVFIAVGYAPFAVTLVVVGVVHLLAGYLGCLAQVAVPVDEEIVDHGPPVGQQYVFDVLMRIDEGGTECLACTDGILLFDSVGAVLLLGKFYGSSLTEQEVGGASYEGIAVTLGVGV